MTQDEVWLLQEKYNGEKTASFFSDCERLHAGEPLAYILGSIPFLDTIVHLESRPLIPRPETEFWVEKAIQHIQHVALGTPHILDVCAGSGAIGIAVAHAVPGSRVDFAEISAAHQSTIVKNIDENFPHHQGARSRFRIFIGDLFDALPTDARYDFILTNPPYIDAAAHTVTAEVTAFEPHEALFGGKDGTEIITRIIIQAKQYLTERGELWIEHEPTQSSAIEALATRYGYTTIVHTDQYKVERFSRLCMSQ
jgi:release factor glutamine methyltransferase